MASYAKAASRSKRPFRMVVGKNYLSDLIDGDQYPGGTIYLNANSAATAGATPGVGNDGNDGKSWDSAVLTMSKALSLVKTGGRILFIGDVREEITGSNLLFDITIQGAGSLHHPDLPAATYHPGGAMWRPPASPTTATPLLVLRGRGWRFVNVVFDCPVDAAAVQIVENGGSGTAEYSGGHARFEGCLFRQGQYGVELSGAGHNIVWDDCEFFLMNNAGNTGCGIIQTSTSVALGFKNIVRNCRFVGNSSAGGNDRHIVAAWQSSLIIDSTFEKVEGSGKYIDLTGGNDNTVYNNFLAGAYDVNDYVAGTNDNWTGNQLIADVGPNTALKTTGSPTTAS